MKEPINSTSFLKFSLVILKKDIDFLLGGLAGQELNDWNIQNLAWCIVHECNFFFFFYLQRWIHKITNRPTSARENKSILDKISGVKVPSCLARLRAMEMEKIGLTRIASSYRLVATRLAGCKRYELSSTCSPKGWLCECIILLIFSNHNSTTIILDLKDTRFRKKFIIKSIWYLITFL